MRRLYMVLRHGQTCVHAALTHLELSSSNPFNSFAPANPLQGLCLKFLSPLSNARFLCELHGTSCWNYVNLLLSRQRNSSGPRMYCVSKAHLQKSVSRESSSFEEVETELRKAESLFQTRTLPVMRWPRPRPDASCSDCDRVPKADRRFVAHPQLPWRLMIANMPASVKLTASLGSGSRTTTPASW